MPLVRLLEPVEVRKVRHLQGETVRVEGQEASRLLAEGRGELVREQPREKASKSK